MAENPNWENDDSLFIKALLCGMHRDSIAFVVETEKEPKIGRLLLQKSFASCVCCYRPASSSYRQFDNVALLPLQPPKVLQSRSLTSQSCRTHARSSSRGEKKETKEVPPFRRLIARALLLLLIFFIIWFFFLRLLFLAIITNRQRESPWQRFDDVYAQLLRWQSNIGYGLGDWVSVGIYLSLKCLCVYFFWRRRVADGVFSMLFSLFACLFIHSVHLFIHIAEELTATWRPKSCQKAQLTIRAPTGSASVACCTNCSKAIRRSVNTRRKTSTRSTGWRWPWYYTPPTRCVYRYNIIIPVHLLFASAINTAVNVLVLLCCVCVYCSRRRYIYKILHMGSIEAV